MSGKIFFSVIIPTYNRSHLIAKTLGYVLAQTYSDFEIIIIDDGSTDKTEEIIGSIKDARISYYKIDNAERGAARNYGVHKAKGDYVNFFDSDDALYNSHLSLAEKNIVTLDNPEIFYL